MIYVGIDIAKHNHTDKETQIFAYFILDFFIASLRFTYYETDTCFRCIGCFVYNDYIEYLMRPFRYQNVLLHTQLQLE